MLPPTKRNQGFLEKLMMMIPGLWQEKYKVSLEYLLPDSKEAKKD